MQFKTVARTGALVTSVALLGLSGSPAMAATPVAQGSATGASVAVGGQTQNTGTYTVSNDGTSQTTTGTNRAALNAAGGQTIVNFGTVAQDATTRVTNGDGITLACAGAAGQGASVAAVGSGTCLTGGDAVRIADSINLQNVTITDNQAAAPLTGPLQQAVMQTGVAAAINTATAQVFTALGNPAVTLDLGALQSSCQSDPSSATGTANLANAGAFINLPALPGGGAAQRITLLDLPVNPAPNTKVVANLDKVSAAVLAALTASVTNAVNSVVVAAPPAAGGALSPITDPLLAAANMGIAQVQQMVISAAIAQLQPALLPLQQNVIDGTLNLQSKAGANQITVTALDLKILPVAGANALQMTVGTSSCGPNGRLVAPAAATTSAAPDAPRKNRKDPVVPTSVPAGVEDAGSPLGPWGLAGLGGLLALAAVAGGTTYRRGLGR